MTEVSGPALALLLDWLPPNTSEERPQVQVATVDEEGRPDIRTVLLSEWDEHGFAFHTDAASRKVVQLTANPAVALEVLWPGFRRRLVGRGTAHSPDRAALDRAYAARSPHLRQLAWLNTAEMAQPTPSARAREWARFAAAHDMATLAAPESWAGFVVRPDRLTFWLPDPLGPSHRVEYRAHADGWSEHHLPG